MKGSTIIRIIKDNPELTSEGIEWNLKNKNFKLQRIILLESQDEIRKCIWWLQDFYKPNKSMKNLSSSYGLKHLVEKYYDDYVSNGSFVTAAKYLRLKCREFKGDPNIYLPFSKKKLKEYNKNILTLKNKLEEPNE
jgi:hypothetical protein